MNRRELLGLVGALGFSGVRAEEVLAWATTAQARSASPETLSERQLETLDAMSELILPETDTPGARAAGVARFADHMATAWLPAEATETLRRGLDALDAASRERAGVAFAGAGEAVQVDLLRESERRAQERRQGFSASPQRIGRAQFFDLVKWLTLFGYYTSEVGMREELGYRTVPGRWDPCVDVRS